MCDASGFSLYVNRVIDVHEFAVPCSHAKSYAISNGLVRLLEYIVVCAKVFSLLNI